MQGKRITGVEDTKHSNTCSTLHKIPETKCHAFFENLNVKIHIPLAFFFYSCYCYSLFYFVFCYPLPELLMFHWFLPSIYWNIPVCVLSYAMSVNYPILSQYIPFFPLANIFVSLFLLLVVKNTWFARNTVIKTKMVFTEI